MPEYTNKEVAEKIGLTSINIKFYTREGVVEPISGGGKRGQRWKYSERNLKEFALIERLSAYGITVQVIKGFIKDFGTKAYGLFDRYSSRMIKSSTGEKIDPYLILYSDKKNDDYVAVYIASGKKKVFSEMEERGFDDALIINLGRLFDRIEAP